MQIEALDTPKQKQPPQSITIQKPETKLLPLYGSSDAAITHWIAAKKQNQNKQQANNKTKTNHHKIKLAKVKTKLLWFSSRQVEVALTENALWSLEKVKTHVDPKTNNKRNQQQTHTKNPAH